MKQPLVIIGAGPIGLAAAANAQARGLRTLVLEAGETAGAAVREWGHVRLFSAWPEVIDPRARDLLTPTGWAEPHPQRYPTGHDWVTHYLTPLAEALHATDDVEVRYAHRVTGVARHGRDRLVDSGRHDVPFSIHVQTPDGEQRITASAVVDASGTWTRPNPLGGDGLPALGETRHSDRITYGIPDLTHPDVISRYAGKHIAVAGTGASAQNVLLGLDAIASQHPGTRVSWLVRRAGTDNAFGGGDNDQLEARGDLGRRARRVAESGTVTVVPSFRTCRIAAAKSGALDLTDIDGATVTDVDEIIVVTGFRPDLTFLTEVRLNLDPVLSAPAALAPLIDPNVHSCATVEPHGALVLEQPEHDLYLAGMKSYGRAPSFLALTGFEQTRSIIAAIAGDHEAAARVELTLPDSGVCGGSGTFDGAGEGGCCTPSAPAEQLHTIGGPVAR